MLGFAAMSQIDRMPRHARTDEAMSPAPVSLAANRSPMPLYHRLYVILRERIATGVYRVGHVLPSEASLIADFGVSRITAKRALDELSSDGLVHRARGRGTTVVSRPKDTRGSSPIRSDIGQLMQNLFAIGRDTSVELLEFGYVPAPAHIAEQLHIAEGALVQRAVRVRTLANEPLSQSSSFVREEVGRSFDEAALASAPLIDLIGRAGVEIATVEQSITATLASSLTASRLGVAIGNPLLLVRRVMSDAQLRPVELLEVLYRPDRFEYRILHTRPETGIGPFG